MLVALDVYCQLDKKNLLKVEYSHIIEDLKDIRLSKYLNVGIYL